jgi:hypothetical protein
MGIIETLQAEIQSLKERVTALEQIEKKRMYDEAYNDYLNGDLDEIIENAVKEARQLTRDDIIEMAKRDIEALKTTHYQTREKYYIARNLSYLPECDAEFIINRDKRTVVCLLRKRYEKTRVVSRGIAKCHPDDCFNAHIGRAIALRRALGLEVPDEYLNAPQPTEVRVGDVVKWGDGSIYRIKNISGKEYNFEKLNEKFESIRFISRVPYPRGIEKFSKVIDDTREEV